MRIRVNVCTSPSISMLDAHKRPATAQCRLFKRHVWVSFYRGWTPISKTFAAKCVRIFSDAWNMADTLANFDGVVPKLVPLVRMLSSSAPGEILNAVRAILRLLANANLDIHALVECIERGSKAPDNSPLAAQEMQKIYDTAYAKGFNDGSMHGRKSAVLAGAPIATFGNDVGAGVNGYSWQQIAQHCALNKHLFYGKDFEFVESIAEQLEYRPKPSPPQAKWLKDLFIRKFGGQIK
jgi:hypothetical protein